jgi:hypothetical protein
MKRYSKQATALSVILLAAAILAAFSMTLMSNAQSTDAQVVVSATEGGTTIPAPGNYTYAENEVIALQAMPLDGYAFHYWIITGEVTPGHEEPKTIYIYDPVTGESVANYTFPPTPTAADSLIVQTQNINGTCGYGYTFEYTAVFTPVSGGHTPGATPEPTPSTTTAVVVVSATTGGTVSPAPGTWVYNAGQNITLTATADPGYAFHYWVASGTFTQGHTEAAQTIFIDPDTGQIIGGFPKPQFTGIDNLVFSNNPATITCGYGYTFDYLAVFTPVSSTSPTPDQTTAAPTTAAPTTAAPTTVAPTQSAAPADMTSTYIIIAVVVVVIIIIIAVAAVMMRKKK